MNDLDGESSQGRWVHVDPCEGIFDAPLVYELGWKKKLSYIFGYTVPVRGKAQTLPHSAVDVTDIVWKYTANFKDVSLQTPAHPLQLYI